MSREHFDSGVHEQGLREHRERRVQTYLNEAQYYQDPIDWDHVKAIEGGALDDEYWERVKE